MRQRIQSAHDRFHDAFTIAQQRFFADCLTFGLLSFAMGCLWGTVGRWIAFGATLMVLPKLLADAGALLDVELLRTRLGKPIKRGRHSAPTHFGKHPRPTRRR